MFWLGFVVGILLTLAVVAGFILLWVIGAHAVIVEEEEQPEVTWRIRTSTR